MLLLFSIACFIISMLHFPIYFLISLVLIFFSFLLSSESSLCSSLFYLLCAINSLDIKGATEICITHRAFVADYYFGYSDTFASYLNYQCQKCQFANTLQHLTHRCDWMSSYGDEKMHETSDFPQGCFPRVRIYSVLRL
jgi:hypothetical protein